MGALNESAHTHACSSTITSTKIFTVGMVKGRLSLLSAEGLARRERLTRERLGGMRPTASSQARMPVVLPVEELKNKLRPGFARGGKSTTTSTPGGNPGAHLEPLEVREAMIDDVAGLHSLKLGMDKHGRKLRRHADVVGHVLSGKRSGARGHH